MAYSKYYFVIQATCCYNTNQGSNGYNSNQGKSTSSEFLSGLSSLASNFAGESSSRHKTHKNIMIIKNNQGLIGIMNLIKKENLNKNIKI